MQNKTDAISQFRKWRERSAEKLHGSFYFNDHSDVLTAEE